MPALVCQCLSLFSWKKYGDTSAEKSGDKKKNANQQISIPMISYTIIPDEIVITACYRPCRGCRGKLKCFLQFVQLSLKMI